MKRYYFFSFNYAIPNGNSGFGNNFVAVTDNGEGGNFSPSKTKKQVEKSIPNANVVILWFQEVSEQMYNNETA